MHSRTRPRMLPHERRAVDRFFRRLASRVLLGIVVVAILGAILGILGSLRQRDEQLHGHPEAEEAP